MVGRLPRPARSRSPTARRHRRRPLRHLSSFVVTSSIARRRHAHRLAGVDGHGERDDGQLGRVPDRRHGEVDGAVTPYQFNGDPSGTLDTTTLSNGAHTLVVQAHATDGRTATATSSVTVTNGPATAPPTFGVTSSIADGATLTGTLTWTANPTGDTPVTRVDFLIDGTSKSTGSSRPVPVRRRPCGPARHDDAQERAAHARGDGVRNRRPDRHRIVVGHGLERGKPPAACAVVRKHPAVRHRHRLQDPGPGAQPTRTSSSTRSRRSERSWSASTRLTGNQSQVDTVVNGVLSRGMEPILVLFGTTGPISPSTAAAFAGSQAAKWKGRVPGSTSSRNEPDLHGWTGTTYAKALIPVYDAIKAADPKAIVIAGALWTGAGRSGQVRHRYVQRRRKGSFRPPVPAPVRRSLRSGNLEHLEHGVPLHSVGPLVMDAHGDQSIPIGATEAGGSEQVRRERSGVHRGP